MTKARSNATAPAAKGQLVVGDGTDSSATLAVGSNNTVLTADSSTATGLKWATPAAGGMTLISTTTLSGASTTINIDSNTYIDLVLYIESIDMSANADTSIRVNGETGSTAYQLTQRGSYGSSGSFTLDSAQSRIFLNPTGSEGLGSGNLNFTRFYMPNANSTIRKVFELQCGAFSNNGNQAFVTFSTATVASTAVISSLAIITASTFDGGTAKLYGVK